MSAWARPFETKSSIKMLGDIHIITRKDRCQHAWRRRSSKNTGARMPGFGFGTDQGAAATAVAVLGSAGGRAVVQLG